MRTTFISTRAISEATRLTLMKSQVNLANAIKEADSGRHADVGVALGYKTGTAVSFRQDITRLESIQKSNDVANMRLEATQLTLKDLHASATKFHQSALLYKGSPNGALSTVEAKAAFNSFMDMLNTANDGAYLFAGINSDVKPVTYAGAAQASVQTAFSALGVPANISEADMATFLDGPFATLFNDTNWKANWSQASDTNIKSRISTNEMIDTSTNANEEPMRLIMQAATMMSDLSNVDLQPDTLKVVADRAQALLSRAITGLSNTQGALGISEQRIADSNERMTIQVDMITNRVNMLEGVDPNEAALRVTALEQQIELSYSMTGRLQNLNILDYL
jgi:flagellar hook-associated protein 3 FlgL